VDARRVIGRPFPDCGKGGDEFAALRDNSKEMISGTVICLPNNVGNRDDAGHHGESTTNGNFLRGFLKERRTGRI
jgi:hypothetical protein